MSWFAVWCVCWCFGATIAFRRLFISIARYIFFSSLDYVYVWLCARLCVHTMHLPVCMCMNRFAFGHCNIIVVTVRLCWQLHNFCFYLLPLFPFFLTLTFLIIFLIKKFKIHSFHGNEFLPNIFSFNAIIWALQYSAIKMIVAKWFR